MIKVNDKRFMENDWDTNISCNYDLYIISISHVYIYIYISAMHMKRIEAMLALEQQLKGVNESTKL